MQDKKILKSKIKISGRVRAIVENVETGEKKEIPWGDNLVTDVGEALVAAWLAGEGPTVVNYSAVGSDNTGPTEGDTALGTEIDRLQVTSISRSGAVVTYSTFYGISDGNGSWEEHGLFNDPTTGTMFARALFSATVNKTTSLTVTVDHEITVGGA